MDRLVLEEFFYNNQVIVHPAFLDEFEEIIKNSGDEKNLTRQLLQRIRMISELGTDFLRNHKLERLKACGNLYSMHLDTKNKNLRVLFSRLDDGTILLHTFEERQGKRKTGYGLHTQVAIERREEMLESRRNKKWIVL